MPPAGRSGACWNQLATRPTVSLTEKLSDPGSSVRFVGATGVGSVVAALAAAVDGLLSADLTGVSSTELTQVLAGVEVQRRRLDAVDVRLVAEVEERRVCGDYARTCTADLLVSLLHVSRGEAKARVDRAVDLGPRRTLDGQPLPVLFPLVAEALAAGAVSAGHADVITGCLDAIPGVFLPDAAPVAERLLVDTARHTEPGMVARTGRELLARLDPDGVAPSDADHQRRRGVTLAERRDGTGHLTGNLTPEALAVWRTVLDALSAPNTAQDTGESVEVGGCGMTGPRRNAVTTGSSTPGSGCCAPRPCRTPAAPPSPSSPPSPPANSPPEPGTRGPGTAN